MKINIFGKNIDVTDGLRAAVEDKMSGLDRYFSRAQEADVTLSVSKGQQKVEVAVPVKGNLIRVEEASDDMYVSIDLAEQKMERQLVKYKNKLVDKKRGYHEAFADTFFEDYDETEDDEQVKIVRTKRFGIKPMDAEEACVQMELLGHNFFVFLNSETEEVNVVYRRNNGTYGLIEPELD